MTKNEIIELIDELSERLEGPAEQLFELAVRSTFTAALMTLIACAITLAGSIYAIRWARGHYVEANKDRGPYSSDGEGYAAIGIMAGILAVVAFAFLVTSIHQLLNIEFYAIKSLVPGL